LIRLHELTPIYKWLLAAPVAYSDKTYQERLDWKWDVRQPRRLGLNINAITPDNAAAKRFSDLFGLRSFHTCFSGLNFLSNRAMLAG
jgi:hypothetical protein